jgi:hypothetical protein
MNFSFKKFHPLNFFKSWILPIGEIAAVILLLTKFFPSLNQNNVIAFWFLGLSLIIAIIANFIFTLKWDKEKVKWDKEKNELIELHKTEVEDLSRKASYADIQDKINESFSDLDRVLRTNNCQEKEYIICFTEFCTRLANIFAIITKVDCYVCIKLGTESTGTKLINDYKAFTLCRDTLSKARDHFDDKIEHFYKDNTDFEMIFKNIKEPKGRFFFCNSLPSLLYYNNTSFQKYTHPIFGFPPKTPIEDKKKIWPLEYRSTIVAPICPSLGEDRNADKLLGFLCLDSNSENKFHEKYDVELLIGCADGIFNVLNQFLEKFPKNNIQNNTDEK